MKIESYKFLSHVFHAYLSLVAATGHLEVIHEDRILKNVMVGYWHGDSYCMQLILRRIARKYDKINVIVTADRRGDIIEEMLSYYKASAIRLPDGLKMRPFFRELKDFVNEEDGILAASLDGPVGPLHEPKKLLFLLASEAQKQVVSIHFQYRRVLRLRHRWDHYVIPLPFCRITATVEDLGTITKEDLKNFNGIKNQIKL